MPGQKFLEWAEIRDFSPGLVTQPDWVLSPSSAQQMLDCYPLEQGGLRAFIKPTSFTVTGIQDIAHEKVIGIGSFHRPLRSGAAGDARDRYLATISIAGHSVSANTVRIYRFDGTANPTPTSWTLIKTHAAVAATPNPVLFDSFTDSVPTNYVLYNLFQTSADDGLWSIDYPSQPPTPVKRGTFEGPVAVQDDRIIASTGSTLRWSDSQSVSSFPAANNLPVQLSKNLSTICCIVPSAPSTLFIGTRAAAWEMVQGSITDPIIRTMSDARPLGYFQKGCYTPNGMAFCSQNTGVFLTQNGMAFQDISAQLLASTWGTVNSATPGAGEVVFQGNFIWCAHGLVYDIRTKAWFQTSYLSTNDHYHSAQENADRTVFAATAGVNFSLYEYAANETNSARAPSWTWKSAPIRGSDGRQIRFREIQVFAKPYGSGATMTVTIGGVAHTLALRHTSGFQQQSFFFNVSSEETDITVTSNSNNAAIEAPSIEVIRVGTRSGHKLRS